MEKRLAIITGADGGMGRWITKAFAKEGLDVIMACRDLENAEPIAEKVRTDTRNDNVEVRKIDLSSMSSVYAFIEALRKENRHISVLMNNAGILTTKARPTEDGLETLVSVNYIAPYMLTRSLLPQMMENARIVNTVSCTYAIGKITPEFFSNGMKGNFHRIPAYSNTKLALLLFTQELARRLKEKKSTITVNAADPGIVSTKMIKMNEWFDPLTDIFFRPFIKRPLEGASTAIALALWSKFEGVTGKCFADCREKQVPGVILHHPQQLSLWNDTEQWLLEHKIVLPKIDL